MIHFKSARVNPAPQTSTHSSGNIYLTNSTATSPVRLIGAHMPTAGGLHKSLESGSAIGCTAVQLFTGNPRQWVHPILSEATIEAFEKAKEGSGIEFLVAHDSYLINLAAPDEAILERSRNAFRGELDRAQLLGIPWVVTHMGAHLDKGEDEAIARLVESLKRLLDATDAEGYTSGVALETTAGQGTGLGWRFEQIGRVLDGVGPHPRLGVCLDTCHIFVAGYDLRDPAAYEATWAEFDRTIGIDKLKVIHANDAKKGLGSRVDRHEHLGRGEIGSSGFALLMRDPRLAHVPVIVETPDSEVMHALNVQRLQRLAAGGEPEILISMQYFGHYTDLVGPDLKHHFLAPGGTLGDFVARLEAEDPRLAGLGRICRFALDEEYADLACVLTEGAAVVAAPPVSGG